MRLKIYTNAPLIAKEDIIVYKVLVKKLFRRPSAPTFSFAYRLKKLYKIENPFDIFLNEIEEGFHSFKYLGDSIDCITDFANFRNSLRHLKIYECVIPKDSEYFEGHNSYNGTPGLVSNQIIIKKRLEHAE